MFTLGELVLIELSLIREAKEMDLSMQVGQQYMEIIGKCERGIAKLQAAAQAVPPLKFEATADEKKV